MGLSCFRTPRDAHVVELESIAVLVAREVVGEVQVLLVGDLHHDVAVAEAPRGQFRHVRTEYVRDAHAEVGLVDEDGLEGGGIRCRK